MATENGSELKTTDITTDITNDSTIKVNNLVPQLVNGSYLNGVTSGLNDVDSGLSSYFKSASNHHQVSKDESDLVKSSDKLLDDQFSLDDRATSNCRMSPPSANSTTTDSNCQKSEVSSNSPKKKSKLSSDRNNYLLDSVDDDASDSLLYCTPKKSGHVFSGPIESTNIHSPSTHSFGRTPKSDSVHTFNSKRGIVKSESIDTDRPVLHVQFHSGANGSLSTAPIKDNCESPTISTSSSSSSSSSEDGSSIGLSEARAPDGGWGWVIVAASFMVNLIADGFTFSFGVIFVEFLNYFGEGKSKTAWIGSFFMAMPLLSGPIASFLTDRYGCRKVSIAGSILACSGFVISSFSNSMEVLFLTFGVIAGFGLSLCYVAAVVIVAYYFDKKRSFATGLSVCGSGIGTFIFAPLTQYLIFEYGWRGTTLILAGVFLNLAVCGALMRDLPWTSSQYKAKYEERKRTRRKRKYRNESSGDSFSVSNSTNTASMLQPLNTETPLMQQLDTTEVNSDDVRLSSSLVNLPTFVNRGEKVPLEVLELLSTHKNVYNVLLQNYPSLLISSRSFSDSGRLHEMAQSQAPLSGRFVPIPSPLVADNSTVTSPTAEKSINPDSAYIWWLKRTQADGVRQRTMSQANRKIPTAYLKDLRMHRHSLTYRGAMLNINRYRLRASSCPNIYRNSMTTIAKEKSEWSTALWDFWDLLVDMLDFSYFADPRFLLFTLSNFLLYTWYDVPYMYLTDNAIKMGYSDTDASMLISMIGIVNMVGEILLGWIGDQEWANAGIVYALCMFACGAVTAVIPLLMTSYVSLCVTSGAFGFFIAANYSLTSIILVEIIKIERFTNAYGLLLLVQGIANLVGPPVAGWICDITGTYDLSFYTAGLFIAISGALLVILPATKRYKYFQTLQRQASSSLSVENQQDNNTIKEPKFHKILASCITGNKGDINKCNPVNDV